MIYAGNTSDLESVVYEIIRYFMKWGMWKDVYICCGGKVYADAAFCADRNLLKAYERAFGMSGISNSERQIGFRGLENVAILTEQKAREPLITLYHESSACDLFWDGCLNEIDYPNLSEEAKLFLFENTPLGETVLNMLWAELPHEVKLDKEHIAAYDDLVEEIVLSNPGFRFMREVSKQVIDEFYAIFKKHGLEAHMESAVSHTVGKQKSL